MNILVADDEKDIRNLIKLHLIKEGYEVFIAKDGLEALNIFQKEAIQLAILDVNMPKIDGFNLINKIRETSQMPVLFLTARSEDEDKILGLGLGADDYLSKPISMMELVARVKAHLRRNYNYLSDRNTADIIEVGNITIDLNQCKVSNGQQELDLNAKEYKLLTLLAKNKNRVFTKKQIYEDVWGDYYYGDDNTIMVYVSRLRKKIEKDPQQPDYIKTIRGIGYKLEERK